MFNAAELSINQHYFPNNIARPDLHFDLFKAIIWLQNGSITQKMKNLSFTHLQVVPNLYEFLSSVEQK